MREKEINDLLIRTEKEENVSVQYACESGSRAWGFASPNSDFDIRFLYVSAPETYLSVFEKRDTIIIPIKDDLDPGGWDVKKALGLLAKSNGALIEWLHSPIIYSNVNSFRERWQGLVAETLNPNHLINHYRGLASQIQKKKLEGDTPSAKGYLYAARAILAAQWVNESLSAPPVPFTDLLTTANPTMRALLEGLVEWKATKDEIASKGRIPELDQFISEGLSLEGRALEHSAPDPEDVRNLLDEEYRNLINLV